MALYLQELAIKNVVTGEAASLTNVMEGVDGSAVFGYNTENVSIQQGANVRRQYMTRHTLDIRVIDDADPTTQALFTKWANRPDDRFIVSGYGGGEVLIWDEPVSMTFERAYDGIRVRRLFMTLDAVPGYTLTDYGWYMPVYAGRNLLGNYDVTRTYDEASANGWLVSLSLNDFDLTTPSAGQISASTAEITQLAAGYINFAAPGRNAFFPFTGLQVTASITAMTDAPPEAIFAIFDAFANTTEVELAGTFTRYSVVLTIQNNISATPISLELRSQDITPITIQYRLPCVRIDGGTDFVL